AETAAAVRQATRAPAERPPETTGRGNDSDPARRAATSAAYATSRRGGRVATLRPATRHGWSISTTVQPASGSASASAATSAESCLPPAPCESSTVPREGWPGWRKRARPGPSGVSMSRTPSVRSGTDDLPRRGVDDAQKLIDRRRVEQVRTVGAVAAHGAPHGVCREPTGAGEAQQRGQFGVVGHCGVEPGGPVRPVENERLPVVDP